MAAKKEAAATEAALESDLQEAKDAAQHAKAEQRKAEAARYDAFLADAHCIPMYTADLPVLVSTHSSRSNGSA